MPRRRAARKARTVQTALAAYPLYATFVEAAQSLTPQRRAGDYYNPHVAAVNVTCVTSDTRITIFAAVPRDLIELIGRYVVTLGEYSEMATAHQHNVAAYSSKFAFRDVRLDGYRRVLHGRTTTLQVPGSSYSGYSEIYMAGHIITWSTTYLRITWDHRRQGMLGGDPHFYPDVVVTENIRDVYPVGREQLAVCGEYRPPRIYCLRRGFLPELLGIANYITPRCSITPAGLCCLWQSQLVVDFARGRVARFAERINSCGDPVYVNDRSEICSKFIHAYHPNMRAHADDIFQVGGTLGGEYACVQAHVSII